MTYGYVRVSSRDQNEERQMIAMQDFGVEKKQIYLDRQSGKDFERPQYQRLMRKIKSSDPCSGQRPHHGIWHLHRKHARRRRVGDGFPVPNCGRRNASPTDRAYLQFETVA